MDSPSRHLRLLVVKRAIDANPSSDDMDLLHEYVRHDISMDNIRVESKQLGELIQVVVDVCKGMTPSPPSNPPNEPNVPDVITPSEQDQIYAQCINGVCFPKDVENPQPKSPNEEEIENEERRFTLGSNDDSDDNGFQDSPEAVRDQVITRYYRDKRTDFQPIVELYVKADIARERSKRSYQRDSSWIKGLAQLVPLIKELWCHRGAIRTPVDE